MTIAQSRPPEAIGRRWDTKAGAKASLRRWGIVTASRRPLPDFLILGGKRAASTSLWNYVVRHPDVLPMFPARQKIKGTSYFSTEFWRGERWYRSHFPTEEDRRRIARDGVSPVAGETTPYYLFHPLAPERAASSAPDVKLIAILRNPVDRAYSHYKERVRHGAEPLSFGDALDAEPERLAGEEERILAVPRYASVAHEHLSYVAQGRYIDMVERWLACFPRERLLILLNESFDVDPGGELARVFAFLGIRQWRPPELERYNFHPAAAMPMDLRTRLLDTYRDDNRRLTALLGIDLSTWDR